MSTFAKAASGYLGAKPENPSYQVMVIDDRAYKIYNVVVHKFTMGDVEDPDLYAGQPIMDWQKSESGKWIMEHAIESPVWHRHTDYQTYGYQYAITAKLKDVDYTFWTLKWNSR